MEEPKTCMAGKQRVLYYWAFGLGFIHLPFSLHFHVSGSGNWHLLEVQRERIDISV
jgi:hypothetical protein